MTELTQIDGAESKQREARGPSVAVCIGTYNQSQYLRGAIESALAQTYPINEILVSDDCSTDDTPQVMERICLEYPQVQYFRQPKNVGPSANLSNVLEKPKTDFVVRLDSDDRLEPDYVEVLVGLMCKYPSAGYAHCNVYELDEHGARVRNRILARKAEFQSPEDSLRSSASGFKVAANCILYRAEALRQADYFYPNLTWVAAEDWDLCIRLAINGWGNVYSDKLLSNYRFWTDSQQVRAKRKMPEVEQVTLVYKNRLEPEYVSRGWSLRTLEKNRCRKAVGYADAIDSPLFSEEEREAYKRLLRELGGSFSLTCAIFLAEHGFNPLVRSYRRGVLRVKDQLKARIWRSS